jgi:signal transduction histidine kinase/AmiR/NasT family two-component response regulator
VLGYVTVCASTARAEARAGNVAVTVVLIGAVAVLVSLPTMYLLIHRVFAPIRHLVAATNRIAAGELDARVEVGRSDVIGTLARSFNEMVNKVRGHQQALEDVNHQLADANVRLADANVKLNDANGRLADANAALTGTNHDLEQIVARRTDELERANQRLSSEIAEKDDFLRTVSHDLNAPLRNIAGMASMLLMKHRASFDPDVVHRLERIQRNVEVETGLIGELLELSRIKSRRQRPETVALGDVVREVGDLVAQDLETRGIALTVDAGLPTLVCERARLRQVFQNLVDNAIKYMGDGSAAEALRAAGHPAAATRPGRTGGCGRSTSGSGRRRPPAGRRSSSSGTPESGSTRRSWGTCSGCSGGAGARPCRPSPARASGWPASRASSRRTAGRSGSRARSGSAARSGSRSTASTSPTRRPRRFRRRPARRRRPRAAGRLNRNLRDRNLRRERTEMLTEQPFTEPVRLRPPAHPDGETMAILLVDDDPDCRMLVRDAIDASKVSNVVYEVSNGREALDFLHRRGPHAGAPRPGLIFLDIEMPGMGGQDTLKAVRAVPEFRDIPIVMMTGMSDEQQMRLAAENGANSYTLKPASAEQFLSTVLASTSYWLTIHQYPHHRLPQDVCRR